MTSRTLRFLAAAALVGGTARGQTPPAPTTSAVPAQPPPPPAAPPDATPGAMPPPSTLPPPGSPVPYGPYPYPYQPYPYGQYAYAPPPPPENAEPTTRWYGWQTLVTDGSSLLLMSTAINANAPALGVTGVGGYLIGAPIVHWAHGHVGKGFGSLAMRAGPWLLFAAVASSTTNCGFFENGPNNDCSLLVDTALFAILSIPAAIAIDASVIAREKVEPTPTFSWVPKLDVRKDRATVGIGGTF